ncbi:uncharacterized protein RJT20DRAFT_129731 [Scheffersomyces xylosifermentans]|uniref:uncharacterized protein n=1 Tax=Scheffersomyces xylosifermentans TaxID=1304137 RepID=UPI00315CF362
MKYINSIEDFIEDEGQEYNRFKSLLISNTSLIIDFAELNLLEALWQAFVSALPNTVLSTYATTQFHDDFSINDKKDRKEALSNQFNCVNVFALILRYFLSTKAKRLLAMYYVKLPSVQQNSGNNSELEELLLFPLVHLHKLPAFIKELSNCCCKIRSIHDAIKQDSRVCLIRINGLIEDLRRIDQMQIQDPLANSIDDPFNNSKIGSIMYKLFENDTNTSFKEYAYRPINSANDIKLIGTKANLPRLQPSEKNYESEEIIAEINEELISLFHRKCRALNQLQSHLREQMQILVKLVITQMDYCHLWEDFLGTDQDKHGRDRYFQSIYSCYHDKIKSQIEVTQKVVANQLHKRIHFPMNETVRYCESISKGLSDYKRYMNVGGSCFGLLSSHRRTLLEKSRYWGNYALQIQSQLPLAIELIDQFVALLISNFNGTLCRWLQEIIGERSMHEYRRLKRLRAPEGTNPHSQLSPHSDILHYYQRQLRMNTSAVAIADGEVLQPDSKFQERLGTCAKESEAFGKKNPRK